MFSFILRFVADYSAWIYLLSALGVLWALRSIQGAQQERGAALFTLEREAAIARAQRGVVVLLGILAIAAFTAFVDFSLPPQSTTPAQGPLVETPLIIPTPQPSPTPTTVAPTPTPTRPPRPTPTPPQTTPTPTAVVSPPSCPDPRASITSPGMGAQIRGPVEIRGSAYLETGFEEYTIYMVAGDNPGSEAQWGWIYSSKEAVINGLLYAWDPQGRTGAFTFILRVVKTDRNYLPLCSVTVTIL